MQVKDSEALASSSRKNLPMENLTAQISNPTMCLIGRELDVLVNSAVDTKKALTLYTQISGNIL
jgi:hypothetical protein